MYNLSSVFHNFCLFQITFKDLKAKKVKILEFLCPKSCVKMLGVCFLWGQIAAHLEFHSFRQKSLYPPFNASFLPALPLRVFKIFTPPKTRKASELNFLEGGNVLCTWSEGCRRLSLARCGFRPDSLSSSPFAPWDVASSSPIPMFCVEAAATPRRSCRRLRASRECLAARRCRSSRSPTARTSGQLWPARGWAGSGLSTRCRTVTWAGAGSSGSREECWTCPVSLPRGCLWIDHEDDREGSM